MARNPQLGSKCHYHIYKLLLLFISLLKYHTAEQKLPLPTATITPHTHTSHLFYAPNYYKGGSLRLERI